MKKILLLSLIMGFGNPRAIAQQDFYDINTLQIIELYFSQADWEAQLHILKATDGGYLTADSIIINGTAYDSIAVKFKGSSSYDTSFAKNPFHIQLDFHKNHHYQDYVEIKLSNAYQDPSMIREVLSYAILRNYMHASGANFANLYINNDYIGLYTNTEDVTKDFCAKKFLSQKNNTFIKCNPEFTPGPQVKSNLKYISSDSTAYYDYYQLKSDHGWNELMNLCNIVSNNSSITNSFIDVDRVIWMLAYNNLLVNLDSYSGVFSQNYFLFKDNNGIFNPVVWDLNMSFGGFPFAGASNNSMAALSIANMQNFPPDFHANDFYWPLVNLIMQNPQLKRKYMAHFKTMMHEMFVSGYYINLSNQLQTIIDTIVLTDTNKFFSYTDFQNAMNTDISVGNYFVPGIGNLISARVNYLQSLLEFSTDEPDINSVTTTFSLPTLTAHITVSVSNANIDGVYLGFRMNKYQKFGMYQMYDDGNHNDALPGDNVFGISIMADLGNSEYYIYAENDFAAAFSPQRAEHEFYILTDMTTIPEDFSSENTGTHVSFYQNENLLYINSEIEQAINIQLFDVTGRICYKDFSTLPVFVNISNYKAGIYYIKLGNLSEKVFISTE